MTLASIDIGTNTVLLLIAEYLFKESQLKTLRNYYAIPRIGKGLIKDSPFQNEKVEELFKVLTDYEKEIKLYNCNNVIVNATAAFRNASNGEEIRKKIENQFSWKVNIISGKEEALFSYLGAVSEIENENINFVIDIGGGSTELIFGKEKLILESHSFNFGVVNLTERWFKNNSNKSILYLELKNFLENELKQYNFSKYNIENTIAIAGTPTTIAAIENKLEFFDEEKIEGFSLSIESIKSLINEILPLTNNEILYKYKGIVKGREDVILTGAIILETIMEHFLNKNVIVSTKGIRYGAIYNFIINNDYK